MGCQKKQTDYSHCLLPKPLAGDWSDFYDQFVETQKPLKLHFLKKKLGRKAICENYKSLYKFKLLQEVADVLDQKHKNLDLKILLSPEVDEQTVINKTQKTSKNCTCPGGGCRLRVL